jgi:hypothetical protein
MEKEYIINGRVLHVILDPFLKKKVVLGLQLRISTSDTSSIQNKKTKTR